MRKILFLLLAGLGVASAQGPSQFNPTTQINWPLTTITGSDTPIQSCTSTNYNQPFLRTDVTPNKFGTCGADGWQYRGTTTGAAVNWTIITANTTASCGQFLRDDAVGAITVTLPAIATGCQVALMRGVSAGTLTIAPPGGVSYDGVTTQLPQGETTLVGTDGTGYHSTSPVVAGSGCTITPSLTGNSLTCAGTTTVSVNGSSAATPNFNGTTPAAGTNGKNVTWQVSGSSVSAEVVGDGTATHYLDGTGNYSTPAGSGASYTNVVASSSADTTVAAINAKCTGGQTYVASIPLSIATGGTIGSGCNVSFWAGGVWTVASGQTVTFANAVKEVGAPSSHFAGAGSVAFGTGDAFVEWFGGVGDWNGTTGTGNLAAFNSCIAALSVGNCKIQANSSYKVTGTISIAKSWVGISGTAAVANKVGATIVSTALGSDIVYPHGISGTRIVGNTFKDFVVTHSDVPTGTATGFSAQYTGGMVVDDVQSFESIRGFYLLDNAAYGVGYIANSSAENRLTYSGATIYGFYADGNGNSTRIRNSTYSDNAIGTRTTWGFYCNSCVDFMVDRFEAAGANHGIGLTGNIQDVSFTNPTIDTLSTDCINLSSAGVITATSIQGGECNSTGAYGANIDGGSSGLQIQGMRFLLAGTTASIRLHNSLSAVQGNTILTRNTAGSVGILLDGSSFANISGNKVDNTSGSTTSIAYKFINSSIANTFQDNTAKSTTAISTAAAISFDATSCLNVAYNLNTYDGGAFTGGVVDTCGNNKLATGTTTNAMTANSSGGAAPGTTFDGSVARTFDYHSFGALAAASGVFTGTPDASGATQFKLPVAAGFATLANGEQGYDTTNLNWHVWGNGVDNFMALFPVASPPTSGNCVQWLKTGNVFTLTQAGGPCGTSSGTVTTTGSPVSGDIAAFSGASSITTATATQVNTLIKTLTGCNTATNVYVPQSGTCVAPGSGALTQISQTVVAGTTTTAITFSSIPGTYTNLMLVINGRTSDAAASADLTCQVNGDTGANYDRAYMQGGTAAPAAGIPTIAGTSTVCATISANTAPSNAAGMTTVNFPSYANTTFNKNIVSGPGLYQYDATAGHTAIIFDGGVWKPATPAAITSITLTDPSGHFIAGTTATLYGEN